MAATDGCAGGVGGVSAGVGAGSVGLGVGTGDAGGVSVGTGVPAPGVSVGDTVPRRITPAVGDNVLVKPGEVSPSPPTPEYVGAV